MTPRITTIAGKGPKGPGNHQNGQETSPTRQKIIETAGKRPKQPGNHQKTQKTTRNTKPRPTTLLSFSGSENQPTRSVLHKPLVRGRGDRRRSPQPTGTGNRGERACAPRTSRHPPNKVPTPRSPAETQWGQVPRGGRYLEG